MNPALQKAVQSPATQVKQVRATPQPRAAQQQYQQPQQVAQIVVPQMTPVTHSTEYTRPEPVSDYVRLLYPITAGQFSSHSLHDSSVNMLQPLVSRKVIDQHQPVEDTGLRTTVASLLRATMALKSGIDSEMTWATKLLIKASYELADDFVLEKIGGLSEILLDIISSGIGSLNKAVLSNSLVSSVNGLSHESERPTKRTKLTPSYFAQCQRCPVHCALESALILRNLSLQQENAKFILRLPVTTDVLRRGLELPDYGESLEMKQYCIEICDSIIPTLQINSDEDPLYITLTAGLESDDRSQVLLSLRALGRLSVADEHNRLLQDIRPTVISRLIRFLQLDDAELLIALNAFFFQYTTYRSNTAALAKNKDTSTLLHRLLGLLKWKAQDRAEEIHISNPKLIAVPKNAPPMNPPQLSEDIVRELLTFQEPERAIHWMRACFEEDKEQSVTQILLWQTYRTLFTPFSLPTQNGTVVVSGRPLLQAADVIKMVGNAFNGATAMVTNHPTEGQKFIIRGIKCREHPLSPSGKKYVTCQWALDKSAGTTCSAPFATSKDLYAHLLDKHIRENEGPVCCGWGSCTRFAPDGESDHSKHASHLRIHVSDLFEPRKQSTGMSKGVSISVASQKTMQDEKGEPKGIALTAALTLRNIARAERHLFEAPALSSVEFKRDLLLHITLNPVIAAQASEILCSLK